jgi:uncharacterized membrane protein YbhN (UPF0104 family)
MSPAARRWLHIAGVAAIVTLLAAFARRVDWHAAAAAVRGADPALLAAATLCNLVSLAVKAVRWWLLLRPLGVRSPMLVLRATFAGASLNNLLVAQGGEGARVLFVSRATGVSSARVFAALTLERALDGVSYLILLGGGAWLLALPPGLARWRPLASTVLAAALVALLALGLGTRRARREPGEPALADAPSYMGRFVRAFAQVGSLRRMAVALVLSLAAWALQVATYHLVALAAHLPLPLAGSVAAMLSVGISFLVRATPGNVGVFQAVYALTVASFGVTASDAVAVALLIQIVQVVPTVVIGSLATPRTRRP